MRRKSQLEKVFVIRDGNGKLIRDHTPRDFYLKLQEEIADIITVCISYLNACGYDEEKRDYHNTKCARL